MKGLSLDDATVDSAIIEYLDGEAVIHHSPDDKVMTNSPTYDKQLGFVKQFEGLGGDLPIPGTNDARDRFARVLLPRAATAAEESGRGDRRRRKRDPQCRSAVR